METFFILTEAMYESLGQAIVIYLASRLVLLSFPQLTASARYNLLLIAQCLVFLLFCLNIFDGIRNWDRYSASAAFALQDSEPVSARFFSLRMMIMSKADLIGKTYFIGLGIHFLLYVFGLMRVRSLTRGEAITSGEWSRKLEAWRFRLNISRRVGLVTGEKTGVPFTAGFLKPVIYFPVTAFNSLTTEQAEAILLHELAHIRRNDYLVNLIQKAMEMVLFFNPVCWSLGAEIRREREFCCDDLVVAHTSDPHAYAHGLFILEQQLAFAGPALSATGQKSGTLLERIKRITHMNNQRLALKPGVYALLGFLAAGLSLAWITPATEADLQKDAGKVPTSIKPALRNDLRTGFVDTVPAPDSNEVKKYFSSPEWKKNQAEIKAQSEKLRKQFVSPEWKQHMADIQNNSEELKKYFDSPEWKKHDEMIARHGEKMKAYFESPEWKKQVQDIENKAREMSKTFDSPEWKAKIRSFEMNGSELEKMFNSPEWNSKMKEIEMKSEELAKKFDSPEWKSKMKEMEMSSQQMEKMFNSPEWRNKMKEIELSTQELEKKFNSPEWKNKMKELELSTQELEKKFNSPEWKKKIKELEFKEGEWEKRSASPESSKIKSAEPAKESFQAGKQ